MQLEPLLGRKPQDQQKQSGALKGLQPLSLFKKRDAPCEPLDCFRTLENSCTEMGLPTLSANLHFCHENLFWKYLRKIYSSTYTLIPKKEF